MNNGLISTKTSFHSLFKGKKFPGSSSHDMVRRLFRQDTTFRLLCGAPPGHFTVTCLHCGRSRHPGTVSHTIFDLSRKLYGRLKQSPYLCAIMGGTTQEERASRRQKCGTTFPMETASPSAGLLHPAKT